MRFDESDGKIHLTVTELVTTARRGMPGAVSFDEEEPELSPASRLALKTLLPEAKGRALAYSYHAGEHDYSLTGYANDLSHGVLTLLSEVTHDPEKMSKAELAEARGEGFLLAFLALRADGEAPSALRLIFCRMGCSDVAERREELDADKLTVFFHKCVAQAEVFAVPEIERVTRRVPSMKALKFPYGKMREGQDAFIRESYRTFMRGGTLFAEAPTGTGKTVSALFPAVRALGEGRSDKIFYFTPKTTTARAAVDCVAKMREKGADVRAVVLSAKERICERNVICRDAKDLCPASENKDLSEATLALYRSGIPTATAQEIKKTAAEYAVCPHELSLSYAELCDIVVCDLNYLFDPAIYLRRFFSAPGRYIFLIDEAHNLPDRAREMFSAELTEGDLLAPAECPLLGPFSDTKTAAEGFAEGFRSILFPLLRDELRKDREGKTYGAAHLSALPEKLPALADAAATLTEEEIRKNLFAKDEEKTARLRLLRDHARKLRRFSDTALAFDGKYRLFLFYENERIRAKLFCLDPSARIADRLALGDSALFFSGTLSPLDYYKATLGGDRTSSTLQVSSPFEKDRLFLGVMDKIGTRFSEREETLTAVCRAIAATVSARRGNYMIFSPSFAYSDRICKLFCAKYPNIRVLQQKQNMTAEEKRSFLSAFSEKEGDGYLLGFCVMGGIYSEGIDLAGDRLIGAVVVGIGLPSLSYEREAIAEYYDEKYELGKAFSYLYPGLNRVFQAAGRVIRTETDRGAVVLIDDRFDDPLYRKAAPDLFRKMTFLSDPKDLKAKLEDFWKTEDNANTPGKPSNHQ